MDKHLFKSTNLGHLQEGEEVFHMAVDPTIRDQTHQVQRTFLPLGGLHGPDQGGIFKEGSIRDGLVDPGKILIHDPPRP
jgi:hypothetical protein